MSSTPDYIELLLNTSMLHIRSRTINRRQLIEQYTNLEHLDRETVETLIDYILVGKRIPGTRNVPIEIHWNF